MRSNISLGVDCGLPALLGAVRDLFHYLLVDSGAWKSVCKPTAFPATRLEEARSKRGLQGIGGTQLEKVAQDLQAASRGTSRLRSAPRLQPP